LKPGQCAPHPDSRAASATVKLAGIFDVAMSETAAGEIAAMKACGVIYHPSNLTAAENHVGTASCQKIARNTMYIAAVIRPGTITFFSMNSHA
jgi:hypothetical protein